MFLSSSLIGFPTVRLPLLDAELRLVLILSDDVDDDLDESDEWKSELDCGLARDWPRESLR